MKTKLLIAVSVETVKTKEKEIELPEKAAYYERVDDGSYFPRGLILFAICPRKEGVANNYMLTQVERGKQDSTDFVPTKDCRQEYWLKGTSSSVGELRKIAFDIMDDTYSDFREITKEEFFEKRALLLDHYIREMEA